MKTLLFGGSFDPPHIGHSALLRAAVERIKPDRILIVPAFQAPLKGLPGAPVEDRLKLAKLGLLDELPKRWRERATVDSSEAGSGRTVYTIETLRRLKKRGDELHFVVGSDSAASFPRWREPNALREACVWWTAARPGIWGAAPKHFRLLKGKMPSLSSTEVRQALAEGSDVADALAPEVLKYIQKNGLYGQGLLKGLEESLKPSRYEHSLNVGRLSAALARRWEADETKARLAGLIHDCGRSLRVDKMPDYARKYRLEIPTRTETIKRNPMLLHAYIGEDMAKRRFGIKDPLVLSAVRKHTLGARSMTLLDRVVFVADATSMDRDYPEARKLRELAFKDLDEAFSACVSNKMEHALSRGQWLHPLTVTVWNTLASR